MNVLFISHYSELYGANRSLLALLDGLDHNLITPFVVIPRSGDMEKALKNKDILYLICPFKKWMGVSRFKAPLRLLMNLMVIPVLLWKLKKWKIDLIYTNSSLTPVGAWVAYLAKLPHFWHIREFGWEDYGLKHDFGNEFFYYWLNKARKIITVSFSVRNRVLNNMRDKTIVIYNGVISRDELSKLTEFPMKNNERLVFGIIGYLSPSKGQEDAIRAFSLLQKHDVNLELWIAGSGPSEYEGYLQDLCRNLKIDDKVKFLGFIENPYQFYAQINVILVCSKYEAMGRVTAEAMVAGKAIIGYDSAGTNELIENGVNGFLYNGSVDSLASKMKFCLYNDYSVIASNAKKKGLNKFIIENYAAKIVQEILSSEN